MQPLCESLDQVRVCNDVSLLHCVAVRVCARCMHVYTCVVLCFF
jgi:hypothetical protein